MPKKDSTIRVIELLKERNISPKDIQQKTGINYNTITNALGDNNRNFTTEQITAICEAFNLDKTYCVFGGSSIKNDKFVDEELSDAEEIESLKTILRETYHINPEEVDRSNEITDNNFIYLLPMYAMGGSLTGFAESGSLLQNCEKIISPIKGVDFAISVYGESMSPEYPSGSRVLIKKINPSIFIEWGKTYVLDTPNGVIIKEVHECKDKPGYIKCHSINPDPKFSDFDIPLSEVYGMYRVLMCLSAK